MSSVPARYRLVPYADALQPLADPARIGAVARLFGLRPADPGQARVLELGCGQGTHLLALAARYPDARLLGVDASGPQIAAGETLRAEADLQNVALAHADLLHWQPERGPFDYILCYGVFSWVADEVKQRILELCRETLAPEGLACISYATYPGGVQDDALRDLLRLHAAGHPDAAGQVGAARAVLAFLDQAYAVVDTADAAAFRHHVRRMLAKPANLFYHDDLGVERDPAYLTQMVAWAGEEGLVYVGESEAWSMFFENLPAPVAKTLADLHLDRVQTEQLLDYVVCRKQRTSLFARQDAPCAAQPDPAALKELCLTTPLRPLAPPADGDPVPDALALATPHGGSVTARGLPLVAFLLALASAAPSRVPFARALAQAEDLAGRSLDEAEVARVCNELLRLFVRRELELYSAPLDIDARLPARPRLSPLNLALARHRGLLATAFQTQVYLDTPRQALASLLDGSRDRSALRASAPGRELGDALEDVLAGWQGQGCFL